MVGHVRALVEKMQGIETSIQGIKREVGALSKEKMNNRLRSQPAEQLSPQASGSRSGSPVTCWQCGEKGHVIRDCPRASGNESSAVTTRGCYNCGDPRHFWRDCNYPPTCFECHDRGHQARNCPFRQAGNERWQNQGPWGTPPMRRGQDRRPPNQWNNTANQGPVGPSSQQN